MNVYFLIYIFHIKVKNNNCHVRYILIMEVSQYKRKYTNYDSSQHKLHNGQIILNGQALNVLSIWRSLDPIPFAVSWPCLFVNEIYPLHKINKNKKARLKYKTYPNQQWESKG